MAMTCNMSLLHVRVFKNGDPADCVSSAGFLFGASLPICQLFNFTHAFSRESRSRVVCISQYLCAHTNSIGETSSSNVVLNRFVTETVDLESRTRSRSTCGHFPFMYIFYIVGHLFWTLEPSMPILQYLLSQVLQWDLT